MGLVAEARTFAVLSLRCNVLHGMFLGRFSSSASCVGRKQLGGSPSGATACRAVFSAKAAQRRLVGLGMCERWSTRLTLVVFGSACVTLHVI